jgi:hypothetical protein
MTRKSVVVAVLVLVGSSVAYAAPLRWGNYPLIPLEQDPTWHYFVRLWEADGNGGLHELTPEEFAALGEDQEQTVSILPYPQPDGTMIYGVYHQELSFVLWMKRFPDMKKTIGELAQIGETAKDVYDPTLTPAENDAAGNIDWFVVNGTWYPRTWTKRISYVGQAWSELWGPFGDDPANPEFLTRDYVVSFVPVTFDGKRYNAVKVTITGPAEGGPGVATEAYTFIDGIGMYERYFDLTIYGTMVFKHIATLQSVQLPAIGNGAVDTALQSGQ